jgi:hypothetical protein
MDSTAGTAHPQGTSPPDGGSADDARKTYTIRIDRETAGAFDEIVKDTGVSINHAAHSAIREWVRTKKDPNASADVKVQQSRRALAQVIVSAVTNHLRSNPEWAEGALNTSSLTDEIVTTYLERAQHFYEEKLELSRQFVPWLIDRMFHHISQAKDVCLVVESGSTLKTLFDQLGPKLAERRAPLAKIGPERIEIVTNNFPGAESYEKEAGKVRIGSRTLSETIPCLLVPGKALSDYAAVVGPQAEQYLRERCQPARRGGRKRVRIGLVVGNWVMLEGAPTRPTPLARGEGHKSFKEVLLDHCDEVYLITPLCKIIVPEHTSVSREASLADFNRDFLGRNPSGQKYERVELDYDERRPVKSTRAGAKGPRDRSRGAAAGSPAASHRVKIVTTERTGTGDSIVQQHSERVTARFDNLARTDFGADVQKPIDKVRHMVFPFDFNASQPFDEQLKAELPHKETRDEAFRLKYFRIKKRAVMPAR